MEPICRWALGLKPTSCLLELCPEHNILLTVVARMTALVGQIGLHSMPCVQFSHQGPVRDLHELLPLVIARDGAFGSAANFWTVS